MISSDYVKLVIIKTNILYFRRNQDISSNKIDGLAIVIMCVRMHNHCN